MEEKSKVLNVYENDLTNGILYVTGEINDELAQKIYSSIKTCERNGVSPVQILIDSPGGSIKAGFSIVDILQTSPLTVQTIVFGHACSMAAVIAATAADEGERYIYPHSQFMIHQVLGSCSGQYSDVEIQVEHMRKIKNSVYEALAQRTGKTLQEIELCCDRDCWLDAVESKQFGLVDKIL